MSAVQILAARPRPMQKREKIDILQLTELRPLFPNTIQDVVDLKRHWWKWRRTWRIEEIQAEKEVEREYNIGKEGGEGNVLKKSGSK